MASKSDAHYFQGSSWSSAISNNYHGCDAVWITAFQGDEPVGGMAFVSVTRAIFTQLYSNYEGTFGGPFCLSTLSDEEKSRVNSMLLEEFAKLSSVKKVIASTVCTSSAEAGSILTSAGFEKQPFTGASISLVDGYNHVEMNVIKKNRRNERNRSLKRGCTTGVTTDPKIIDEYYPIYLRATNRWGSIPVPEQLLKDLLADSGGSAFMSWVRLDGKLIGGHLNFSAGGIVTAWNGATDLELKDIFPASVLIFTDVEEACSRGCALLDLGAHGGVDGVEQFKRMFGAESDHRIMFSKKTMIKRIYDKLKSVTGGGA
ncbi:MAG: GNAT family N-acetyltransferase [bacterium]|nr:GNAT family N-acetyltransferase [bacterium]MCP4800555.1 GNAT family N-acetyltransferase [bacterium]